ncbi:N-acetylglucosaminyl-phosphatidylinositol biosynthetic protein [Schistosoma japonicum]|uniref:phosphatidylinositol N-acetylglucosaminyltransferase n=1 Tax=Schistosoma japonicum TaxID=6182 RepID=A0A4Z2CTM0_SCHJA|nr:N-acetylglucosaminyl-phosphatidylinositol biosynthetic protein [Schistosoma japonicum]
MVSDFCHPNVGGIESHIFALSQCLIRRGHRVIIITHSYGSKNQQRQGVRYLARGLKVYYIPMQPFYKQSIFITVLGTLPIIREIVIREQIDIVHGHSIFSSFACEAVIHAQSLGCRTVYTEHSLFGFSDLSAIIMNKVMEGVFTAVDQVICVSHTTKENVVLRAKYDPDRVFVIPNAVDASAFVPDPSCRDPNYITIVVVSRLVYRKGLDLLAAIIPPLCSLFPELRFLIGGDGPKRLELEEIREHYQLHSRVSLLGSLQIHEVRPLLIQGDIFLNTSLTEAFCIAVIEALSCGLMVISTAVGGLPEVLPEHFIRLSPPNASELASIVADSIILVRRQRESSKFKTHQAFFYDVTSDKLELSAPPNPLCQFSLVADSSTHLDGTEYICNSVTDHCWHMHKWIRTVYCWPLVAKRTEKVYFAAMSKPPVSLQNRISRLYQLGPFTGKLTCFAALLHWFLLQFLSWLRPETVIDVMPSLKTPVEDLSDSEKDNLFDAPHA